MSAKSKDVFVAIFRQLKACETRDEPITEQRLEEAWMELVRLNRGDTPSMLAALLVYDDAFQTLITTEERNQLLAIVKKAVDQYERQLHPHTDIGRKLADAINPEKKEE